MDVELSRPLKLDLCGDSYFLEGYGMVHCDQPKGHEGNHCGPLFTEHYWPQTAKSLTADKSS